LIYQLATKAKAQIKHRFDFLIENICNKNLSSENQLDGKSGERQRERESKDLS